MNQLAKKKSLQILFVSYDHNEDPCYLVNLLRRHPEICIFDGTDHLVDNLLKFPNASFGIHNTIFFELLFELFNDKRFHSSESTLPEFEEVCQSKSCYNAFLKIMKLYCNKTKPAATIVAYRFPEPTNFKTLFSNYIVRDLRAIYIHQLTNDHIDERITQEASSDTMLSAICNGILQVKQKNFVINYEYEYKRLFRFLSANFDVTSQPEKKIKKLYKKAHRLSEVQNSWFRQIISHTKKKPQEILVGKVFKD
ncbi:MAG: hypothetical protein ABIT08_09140 [Bacteroidia bacterium]